MESISVGGLASGLDTNSIIDGLSNIEQLKVDRIETKKQDVEDKKKAFEEMIGRIGTFSTKASALTEISNFNLYTAESNDEDIATVSGGEDATEGKFELDVLSLATSQKVTSGAFASTVSKLNFAGEIQFNKSNSAIKSNPVETTTNITISATDTLKDIVSKINSSDGIGVSASILSLSDTDNRIVLTSVDEGSQGFFAKNVSGDLLGLSGLGLSSDTQATRSEFNFIKQGGGAAEGTTKLGELVTGIGANNLDATDSIRITGTKADGTDIGTFDWNFDPSTDDIDGLLTQIEGAFGSDVTASLSNSGEILLTDTTGGVSEMALNLELIDGNASGSTLTMGGSAQRNLFLNELQQGRKAFFNIDGLSVSTQTNNDDNIIRGTKLQLKKADPGNIVKLSLNRDTAGISGKIKGFIEEFNSLLKFIDKQTKVVVKEDDEDNNPLSNSTKVDSKGALAGDSTVRRIRSELQTLMTAQLKELEGKTQYTSLSRIGITSSTSDGTLQIDEKALNKAINTDFDGVRRLFASSGYSDNPEWELGRYTKDTDSGVYQIDTDSDLFDSSGKGTANMVAGKRIGLTLTSTQGDSKGLSIKAASGQGSGSFTFVRGLASQIKQYYTEANDYVDGMFKFSKESMDRSIKEFDDRILTMQDRVDRFRQGLVKQFSDLEQNVSRLQSQQQSFMAQVGSL